MAICDPKIDSRGMCLFHPYIQLQRLSRRTGHERWVVILDSCPICSAEGDDDDESAEDCSTVVSRGSSLYGGGGIHVCTGGCSSVVSRLTEPPASPASVAGSSRSGVTFAPFDSVAGENNPYVVAGRPADDSISMLPYNDEKKEECHEFKKSPVRPRPTYTPPPPPPRPPSAPSTPSTIRNRRALSTIRESSRVQRSSSRESSRSAPSQPLRRSRSSSSTMSLPSSMGVTSSAGICGERTARVRQSYLPLPHEKKGGTVSPSPQTRVSREGDAHANDQNEHRSRPRSEERSRSKSPYYPRGGQGREKYQRQCSGGSAGAVPAAVFKAFKCGEVRPDDSLLTLLTDPSIVSQLSSLTGSVGSSSRSSVNVTNGENGPSKCAREPQDGVTSLNLKGPRRRTSSEEVKRLKLKEVVYSRKASFASQLSSLTGSSLKRSSVDASTGENEPSTDAPELQEEVASLDLNGLRQASSEDVTSLNLNEVVCARRASLASQLSSLAGSTTTRSSIHASTGENRPEACAPEPQEDVASLNLKGAASSQPTSSECNVVASSTSLMDVGDNNCPDSRGRCIHHPDVKLYKKKLFGRGWKALMKACPDCCVEELRRMKQRSFTTDQEADDVGLAVEIEKKKLKRSINTASTACDSSMQSMESSVTPPGVCSYPVRLLSGQDDDPPYPVRFLLGRDNGPSDLDKNTAVGDNLRFVMANSSKSPGSSMAPSNSPGGSLSIKDPMKESSFTASKIDVLDMELESVTHSGGDATTTEETNSSTICPRNGMIYTKSEVLSVAETYRRKSCESALAVRAMCQGRLVPASFAKKNAEKKRVLLNNEMMAGIVDYSGCDRMDWNQTRRSCRRSKERGRRTIKSLPRRRPSGEKSPNSGSQPENDRSLSSSRVEYSEKLIGCKSKTRRTNKSVGGRSKSEPRSRSGTVASGSDMEEASWSSRASPSPLMGRSESRTRSYAGASGHREKTTRQSLFVESKTGDCGDDRGRREDTPGRFKFIARGLSPFQKRQGRSRTPMTNDDCPARERSCSRRRHEFALSA